MSVPKTSLENVAIDCNSNVFYHEVDDGQAGLCVDSDGVLTWSPIKISRSQVKSASAVSSGDEISNLECLSLDYQMKCDVHGIEVETSDIFWVPIAHRTRSKLKSPSSDCT